MNESGIYFIVALVGVCVAFFGAKWNRKTTIKSVALDNADVKKQGVKPARFLRLLLQENYTEDEKKEIMSVRNGIRLKAGEKVCKVISHDTYKTYMNKGIKVNGYIFKYNDLLNLEKSDDVLALLIRDMPSEETFPMLVSESKSYYYMLEFSVNENDIENIKIPYGKSWGGDEAESKFSRGYGFVWGIDGRIVSEFKVNKVFEFHKGARIYKVSNGYHDQVAIYSEEGCFKETNK